MQRTRYDVTTVEGHDRMTCVYCDALSVYKSEQNSEAEVSHKLAERIETRSSEENKR
jgi:hypothetical protein